MNKYMILVLIALLTISLAGCRHKDFYDEYPPGNIYVDVVYDDDNDPDDYVYLRDNVRATRLLAYEPRTNHMILASDIDRNINALHLHTDIYNFIAYNAGTQSITFSDRDFYDAHSANTRECDILEPMYGSRGVSSDIDLGNGQTVVTPCEPIWSVGAESVICHVGDTIRMTALPLHCRYTYEMRNIDGLKGVSRLSSFITGMSYGEELATRSPHEEPVTVAIPASVGSDGRSIIGRFFCFGRNQIPGVRNRMGLFLEMESGQKYKLTEGEHFDVTAQVTGAPNRRRVHIIIDGVRIPTAETGAGFEVDLDPWGSGENVDVDYDFNIIK